MADVDIRALAQLARIENSDEEVAKLEKEIPEIIGFVEAIQKAGVAPEAHAPALRNVMRDDADPHESGIYTEKILSQAPSREGDRVAVKQVVSRNKK
jgi:aspartyl-tRNA(Asn)/glutamyl-tRNA(Gln) amidotransferase subunit C